MDLYWEAVTNYTTTPTDHPYLPEVDEEVWILGKNRSSIHDRDEIADDIRSRLWCTYRKDFPPIGDSDGPTSDSGWGCMHRCGQMMVAQSLLQLHLGRDWVWSQDRLDDSYLRIRRMFEDRPTDAFYSIHEITLKAATSGKSIESWLGPNSVAHAIKKLSVFDTWSNMVVYVTTEDGVVVQEIKNICFQTLAVRRKLALKEEAKSTSSKGCPAWNSKLPEIQSFQFFNEVDDDCVEIVLPPEDIIPISKCPPLHPKRLVSGEASTPQPPWHPLLLIVPLRLGLHEFNPRYISAIKGLFKIPQCVGVIGGRPKHALWFIGYVGDNLLCLDPHKTQPTCSPADDSTFHTQTPVCVPFSRLDPSLAVGFVCVTEAEFDALRRDLVEDVLLDRRSPPIFEVHETRTHNMPPPAVDSLLLSPEQWSDLYDNTKASAKDEEFELI